MNVIQRNYNVGKRRVGVPGNSGYCILVESSRCVWKKMKEERSNIL